MKTIPNINYPAFALFGLACFAVSQLADAQCPQFCDLSNTALGSGALVNNQSGGNNTAIGAEALHSNEGYGNTAIGWEALFSNTDGSGNTAIGSSALQFNTDYDNTAIGSNALVYSTTGYGNTASGRSALQNTSTGGNNTASGLEALIFNTTGSDNTASGAYALLNNTTGRRNIALGSLAGRKLTTGNDNIDIGNAGVAQESGIIRIGTAGTQTATFIAGIRDVPLAHGVAVAVGITADGQLGVRASSGRFKEAIKPMDKTSEAILALKPVTFRYKKEFDPKGAPQFGLVAEEVAKVNPDLVVADDQGKPFTVRYEAVNAMLLNEFLKEHRKVEELEATVTQLQAAFKAQAAQVQMVSDQLRAQARAPLVLVDN